LTRADRLERAWFYRRRRVGDSFAAQAVVSEIERDPDATSRDIAARAGTSHVFANHARDRFLSGDLFAVPHMQATLAGEPVDSPLERLLARRQQRTEARGRAG
jgi:hypothetical protein